MPRTLIPTFSDFLCKARRVRGKRILQFGNDAGSNERQHHLLRSLFKGLAGCLF